MDFSKLLGGQLPGLGNLVSQFENGQHAQAPDAEVTQAYGQVAAGLPHDQYLQAAQDAFSKLSPDQRAQFAQQLQAQAQQHGVQVAQVQASAAQDPAALAAATAQVHSQQPNLLQQMFAPGGTFSNPIAKAALLGITAMAAQRMTSRR